MASPLAYQRVLPYGVGLAPVYVNADPAGHAFWNLGGSGLLHIKNGGGASITVTVHTNPAPPLGPALASTVFSVAAGAEALIGPFPCHEFSSEAAIGPVLTATGRIYEPGYVTFSSVSGVTIAALAIDVGSFDRPNCFY